MIFWPAQAVCGVSGQREHDLTAKCFSRQPSCGAPGAPSHVARSRVTLGSSMAIELLICEAHSRVLGTGSDFSASLRNPWLLSSASTVELF